MPTLSGLVYRMRLIIEILTLKASELPVSRDKVYDVAVEKGYMAGFIPIGNADFLSGLDILPPSFWGDKQEQVYVEQTLSSLRGICRGTGPEYEASSEPDVGRLLYSMVRLFKPMNIIEVGVHRGAGSCHLALGLRQWGFGVLHLVDISAHNLEVAKGELMKRDLALESIEFYCGDSVTFAHSGSIPKADLVFIDADHTLNGVKRDVKAYWPLLKPNGFMILHDSILANGVRNVVNWFVENRADFVVTLATSDGSGITIIRKRSDVVPGFENIGVR